MKAGELLEVFRSMTQHALPGWNVIAGQARTLEDKLIEIVLEDGTVGGFFNGGMEISETVTVRLAVKPSDPPSVAYVTLLEARDSVALAYLEQIDVLVAANVLPLEGNPTLPTAQIIMEELTARAHWASEIRFPVKRRIG